MAEVMKYRVEAGTLKRLEILLGNWICDLSKMVNLPNLKNVAIKKITWIWQGCYKAKQLGFFLNRIQNNWKIVRRWPYMVYCDSCLTTDIIHFNITKIHITMTITLYSVLQANVYFYKKDCLNNPHISTICNANMKQNKN